MAFTTIFAARLTYYHDVYRGPPYAMLYFFLYDMLYPSTVGNIFIRPPSVACFYSCWLKMRDVFLDRVGLWLMLCTICKQSGRYFMPKWKGSIKGLLNIQFTYYYMKLTTIHISRIWPILTHIFQAHVYVSLLLLVCQDLLNLNISFLFCIKWF